jgi:hypothetical protein
LNGKNVPKKNKKAPAQVIAKAGSFRGRMNSMTSTFFCRGVNLDFTVRLATAHMPKIMNAADLIVHGNPIFGMSLETIIGKITPPKDDPDAMVPKAVARFLKNHVPVELMAAKKIALAPSAEHTPCARRNW